MGYRYQDRYHILGWWVSPYLWEPHYLALRIWRVFEIQERGPSRSPPTETLQLWPVGFLYSFDFIMSNKCYLKITCRNFNNRTSTSSSYLILSLYWCCWRVSRRFPNGWWRRYDRGLVYSYPRKFSISLYFYYQILLTTTETIKYY